jgi:hypothetical protein
VVYAGPESGYIIDMNNERVNLNNYKDQTIATLSALVPNIYKSHPLCIQKDLLIRAAIRAGKLEVR